jgi:KDO2-lipid IV(A) lauroyltransferase
MQMVTTIIEGWVREHPEQWLWLHRRWRREHGFV